MLSRADERAIGNSPVLTPEQKSDLLQLASADLQLAAPPELLLLVRRLRSWPQVRNGLREFVAAVLRSHPIFSGKPDLLAVLANQPGAMEPEKALRALAITDTKDLLPGTGTPPKPKLLKSLPKNAVHSLALFLAETREGSLETVAQWLNAALWDRTKTRPKNDEARLRVLIGRPTPATLGLLVELTRAEVDLARRTATAAQQRASAAETKLEGASQELADAQHAISERDRRIADFQAETDRQAELHRIAITHSRDDYENLRGSVISRLRKDVGLLDDGLQALKATPPKVPVMTDYAERVVEAMRRHLGELQGGR